MRQAFNKFIRLETLVFILPIIYFLLYAKWGFCDTDQGFIQGLSWRIHLGQTPYIDFTYVRPPLSIYLHALFLKLPYSILIERFLFYLFISLSTYFFILAISTLFNFSSLSISKSLFFSTAFIISVHNYPPMPWHTVDGILFASLGIYCISLRKDLFSLLGLCTLLLAALCKQSFYLMPLIGMLLLFSLHEKKVAWRVSLRFGVGLIVVLGVLLITWPQHIKAAYLQMGGTSQISDLIQVGIIKYIKPAMLIVLPTIALGFLLKRSRLYQAYPFALSILFLGILLGPLGLHVLRALQEQTFVGPSYGFSQAAFLFACITAAILFNEHSKKAILLIGLLAISWCSGISWGYVSPIMFFSPILFGMIYGLEFLWEHKPSKYVYPGIAIAVFCTYFLLYQFPYREAPRKEINYALGQVFAPLSGIQGGKSIYQKCLDLRALYASYGERYTVLPAFPAANFLTQSHPYFQVDWAHNAEMNYAKLESNMKRSLEEEIKYIFMEKDKLQEATDSSKYGSLISGYVMANWKQVDQNESFLVFANPDNPPLP